MIKKNAIGTFSIILKALVLNLPVLSLLLLRYLFDVNYSGLTVVYIISVFIGYYFLIQFIFVLPAVLLSFFRKVSLFIAWITLSMLLYYFILDGVVYSIYRFHINSFFIELFFIDFENFGFTTGMLFLGVGVLILSFAVEYAVFYFSKRIKNKYLLLIIPIVLFYVLSQVIHIFAFENNRGNITGLTTRMPLYFPIESGKLAGKHKSFAKNVGLGDIGINSSEDNKSINYPKGKISLPQEVVKDSLPNIIFIVLESWRYDMLNSVICPNIYRLSKKSTLAENHFSTGNSTTTGIFGIFYGLHPTYWEAIKANSKAIDNPVLIDLLLENSYDFGVFSHSNFDRFKLKATIFNNIEIHKDFKGSEDWQKDRDMNSQFINYIKGRNGKANPFFGFIFYTSTHHAYSFPNTHKLFEPVGKINMGLVNNDTDPTPFLNAYKNSIHFVDELVENVLKSLKDNGMYDNTVIVLTSDHGEEFNDNKQNYWGHVSNFTRYQTGVPLMMYFPKKAPKSITSTTSHIDIVPTLLQNVFQINTDVNLYSNGENIYKVGEIKRPVVISSYVNHGLIIGENVYAVYPFSLKKYNLYDIKKKINKTDNVLFRQAVEEMNWFYK